VFYSLARQQRRGEDGERRRSNFLLSRGWRALALVVHWQKPSPQPADIGGSCDDLPNRWRIWWVVVREDLQEVMHLDSLGFEPKRFPLLLQLDVISALGF
jgi:hypothetical protein